MRILEKLKSLLFKREVRMVTRLTPDVFEHFARSLAPTRPRDELDAAFQLGVAVTLAKLKEGVVTL